MSVSIHGRAMLNLLRKWQSLPPDERGEAAGYTLVVAEQYRHGDDTCLASYLAVQDVSSLTAPLPIPFCFTRGQA